MINKTYMVKIKMSKQTDMMVSETSMEKAVRKVTDLLSKCSDDSVLLDKIFNCKPNFIYKVEKISKVEKNVQI